MTAETFKNLNKDIELEKSNLDKSLNDLLLIVDSINIEEFNKIHSQGINFFSKFITTVFFPFV